MGDSMRQEAVLLAMEREVCSCQQMQYLMPTAEFIPLCTLQHQIQTTAAIFYCFSSCLFRLSTIWLCQLFQVKSLIAGIHASLSAQHVDKTLLSSQAQQLLELCQEGEQARTVAARIWLEDVHAGISSRCRCWQPAVL
jgi:hypothetical protein